MKLPKDKYLQFFIKKFSMLKSFKIQPYLVFDGDELPAKKGTNAKRREKRIANKAIAEKLWRTGERKNAMDYFQKCVDITPEMAKCVIDFCKNNGIKYVVAPFEADSQMVYLERKGIVNGIISEDSDLLIFGCRRLITKLNDYGECIEICSEDFCRLPRKFPLNDLNEEQRRIMVCLSGCDYMDGIPKVGLITAMKLVYKFKTMERIITHVQREGKLQIPNEFMEQYESATLAFQFQRVFCPIDRRIVTLNEIPEKYYRSETYISKISTCIGPVISIHSKQKEIIFHSEEIDHERHIKIAIGDLDPYTGIKHLANREHRLQLLSK